MTPRRRKTALNLFTKYAFTWDRGRGGEDEKKRIVCKLKKKIKNRHNNSNAFMIKDILLDSFWHI